MSEFLKSLKLSDKAISFYQKLYGKEPLTLNEIHLLSPDLSKKELIETVNELFQARLLIKNSSKSAFILGHYIAIPPLFTISGIISQVKDTLTGKEGSVARFESIIDNVFKNQSKVELEKIYKDFQRLQNDVNSDIATIKQELDDILSQIEEKDEESNFLDTYEQELKNIINSELAKIVIILLQMKAQFKERLKSVGISNDQWLALRDEIKDTLALGIHEKSNELAEIITEEFGEIKESLKEKQTNVLKDRFEQKSVYLGILNMFKTEIDKFHKALLMKKNNLNLDLNSLEKSLNTEITQTYQNLNENTSENILYLEQFFNTFFEDSGGIYQTSIDNFWPIYSKAKFNEEVLNCLKKSNQEFIVIVPNIEDVLSIKALKNVTDELRINIISSDSHESEIVQSITKLSNIEFKRLENKNFFGVLSDNSYLIVGFYQEVEDPLKNLMGFGTNSKPMIDFLIPIFSEKMEVAKYSKNLQINNGFNYIIRNINDIKGKEISKILQDILDIAFEIEGISLDVLELKILTSKLKNVNTPLDNDWKQHVIEKIDEFNQKFSNLILAIPPEFRESAIPASIDESEPVALTKDIKLDYVEDVNAMFDLFLEKIEDLKGTEISSLIEKMVEMVIKFQGYSNIIEWKESLNTINETLQEPFKEKLRDEIINWKNDLLTPTTPIESYSIPSEQKIEGDVLLSAETTMIEEEEYYSPALAELAEPTEEESSDKKADINISEIFSEITQNLDQLSGSEISKKLQEIMDIVLETKGYSLGLKDMRQWISKLRMIKTPIVDEIKSTLKEKLEKWRKECS